MNRILSLLLKICLSILLTLALLEIGLRLFPGVIPLDMLNRFDDPARTEIAQARNLPTLSDSVLLERGDNGPPLRILKPFTTVSRYIEGRNKTITETRDEMGFCNPAKSYQRPQIDIITLGDSFTACHAVYIKDTWTSQLSHLSDYSTYNLGRVGIGIHAYLQIFSQFGVQKSPKVVIMNIYEGNDLRDAAKYYQYAHNMQTPQAKAATPVSTESLPSVPLAGYSYALNLLQTLSRQIEKEVQALSGNNLDSVNFKYALAFSDGTKVSFNPKNIDLDEVRFAKSLQDKSRHLPVKWVIEDALQTFVQLSNEHNFVPIVTYTPSAYTAYANYVFFEDPALQTLMPQFSQEQRTFLETGNQTYGYTFIDLTPALQAAAMEKEDQKLLYFRYDLHLTPAGHEVVAQTLADALQKLGLVSWQSSTSTP